jgi:hypothetical protein
MEPIIHRKETFLDGRVVLLHANSMDLMRNWEKLGFERPDHIITDPPYNQATHANSRKNKKGVGATSTGINFKPFTAEDAKDFAVLSADLSLEWNVFACAWQQVGEYDRAIQDYCENPYAYCGVWHKPTPTLVMTQDRPAPVGEYMYVFHTRKNKMRINHTRPLFVEMDVERGLKEHATQKPEPFFGQVLDQFVQTDQLVLEPFSGSAANVRACIVRGIRVIAIELSPDLSKPITELDDESGDNPDYFSLTVRRTQEAVNNLNALGFTTKQTPKGVKVAPATTMGLV